MSQFDNPDGENHFGIAIVGMSGRFPGAPDLGAFWRNLSQGRESITFFSDEELLALGVPAEYLNAPNFVKAAPVIENIGHFDAGFFGYSPREARLLDPQHRIFLECAWSALESAGYQPEQMEGMTGVFAGTSLSTYLLFNLMTNPELSDAEHNFEVMIGNDKDFLATRACYHFNLRGPGIDVQTGCSTSLVATHLACESLLAFQCDLALAGGVSVHLPQRTGYFAEAGGITSPDGHCRAFDAAGTGTLFGSGVGVVVLKRLAEALADGDTIHAVIRATAINNDGSRKVGFTAPGVDGQAEVVARAMALAEVEAKSIGYVECHGTGTALGDPVELEALTRAFRATTDAREFCAVGSVKTNIGHLDAAAGIAGLIKTVLALKHGQIPPSLHFREPNPKIDFAASPFFVNDRLTDWPAGQDPRRAGVSSFGIGGTNAHVILEEPPARGADAEKVRGARAGHLLLVSARSRASLDCALAQMADYLESQPRVPLRDVSFTLQVGRKRFPFRAALTALDPGDALAQLRAAGSERLHLAYREDGQRSLVLLFPGGGAQYLNMGRDLYREEPLFRATLDQCAAILRPMLGYDLLSQLFMDEPDELAAARIKDTSLALPALFAVEYAVARLLQAWGLEPAAMIGHSMGEYVAATLSGVFTLEDALAVVVLRGRLFERLPRGAMISLPMNHERVRPYLGERLAFAAVNGPGECVVSGPLEDIDRLARDLDRDQIEYRRLQINVAAHSPMIDAIVSDFVAFIEKLHLEPPAIPFISNATGTWIQANEATDAGYWGRQLRQTVLFGQGLETLLTEQAHVFLEVGPGRTLSTLAKLLIDRSRADSIFATMRHPYDIADDDLFLLTTLGKLWAAGLDIDWAKFHGGANDELPSPHRIPLPTYPFERQRYWIDAGRPDSAQAGRARRTGAKSLRIDDWFHVPVWNRLPSLLPFRPGATDPSRRWLIFDDGATGRVLERILTAAGNQVVRAAMGEAFQGGPNFVLRPGAKSDYEAMFAALRDRDWVPDRIAHLWNLNPTDQDDDDRKILAWGFYSLLRLAQAIETTGIETDMVIWIAATGLCHVESGDRPCPARAALIAPAMVIPQEFDQLHCHLLDMDNAATADPERAAARILTEMHQPVASAAVAVRGPYRWTLDYMPQPLPEAGVIDPVTPMREGGVYLITGGLGNVGLLLAGYLARTYRAKLALIGRSEFPHRSQWDRIQAQAAQDDPRPAIIDALRAMEAAGSELLLLAADVGRSNQLEAAIQASESRFGPLDGVVHAAGLAGEKTVRLILDIDEAECEAHFKAKLDGTRNLHRALGSRELDFVLLVSSNVAVLGGLGATAYTAANLFMDSFAAGLDPDRRWISANWDGWLSEGGSSISATFQTSIDQFAMTPAESVEAFARVVTACPGSRVVVSTGNLTHRLETWTKSSDEPRHSPETHPRPSLGTAYVAPETELQAGIAAIWSALLGIDQLGIHDNFFDLGGNSLIAMKVINRMKKDLRREIPVVSLFEGPTVAALAALLGKLDDGPETYEESRERGERRRDRRRKRKTGVGEA